MQQKHKHGEMAFLTSRSMSKHVLSALGVDLTARDTVKAGVLTSECRKLYLSQCRARLVSIHVPLLHKFSIQLPGLRFQCRQLLHGLFL